MHEHEPEARTEDFGRSSRAEIDRSPRFRAVDPIFAGRTRTASDDDGTASLLHMLLQLALAARLELSLPEHVHFDRASAQLEGRKM